MKRIYKKVRKYFEIEKICQHKFDIKEVLDMGCDPKCIHCGVLLYDLTMDKIKLKM